MRTLVALAGASLVVISALTIQVGGQPAANGGVYEAVGALRRDADKLPQVSNFALVGHASLVNPPGSRLSGEGVPRGMNAPLAIAKTCAYVGSRNGLQDTLIVDITNPRLLVVAGFVPGIPLSSSRDMRAFGDLNLLVIGNFRLRKGDATWENPTGADGTVNNFRMYNIADCTRPVLRATIDLGPNVYHEFYLWVDPKDHTRTLLYATFN
ncbi:MAG TPA: hypothetical protein VK881_04025, partial [bacterium]|nr:hypothetical protein [bacterium]